MYPEGVDCCDILPILVVDLNLRDVEVNMQVSMVSVPQVHLL